MFLLAEKDAPCGLCVLSVAKSPHTYVRLEVNADMELSDLGFPYVSMSLKKGEPRSVSQFFAAQPESIVILAQHLPRVALISLQIDTYMVGLWPTTMFAGTPVCHQHVLWADELWGSRR